MPDLGTTLWSVSLPQVFGLILSKADELRVSQDHWEMSAKGLIVENVGCV
jgi:hypothetical protein